MDTPLSKDEIESILGFHFPQVVTASTWAEEREAAIQKCVEDINRRITERIREY